MPTELEELVDFISHGNTQIRQLAVENLVPYSTAQPAIFKTNQLLPIKDLKLLVRDYKEIAKDAITILINLSSDPEIRENLASDNEFINSLLNRLTNPKEPNANLLSILLANLGKSDSLKSLLTLTRPIPQPLSTTSQSSNNNTLAISQLLDIFVRGASGSYNPDADFDYLAYLFADLAKHVEGRRYFLTKQDYDGVIPLTKLTVFTEHVSDVRRRGVASTIKNVAFEVDSHGAFLAEEEINILPYLLLPIMGNEEYDEDDMDGMLPDLQLLPPDKERDSEPGIIQTHVESLMLLTTTREGRDVLREVKVYPIIRETHLRVEDDGVREACERLVQVLMRDEEGEEKVDQGMTALSRDVKKPQVQSKPFGGAGNWASAEKEDKKQDSDDDDDDKIVEV
ncbi:DNA-binding protein-like protein HGH1 [Xylogone sp. PMI_703]|nr:DNA-binding protein-like protein HGH1 [Xylogone sp. PMI_703]